MATAETKESVKETSKEKLKALQLTIEKLEKSYGKGTIMKLGDAAVEQIETISTGSITLDAALGIGGLPKGRVIEIYGPESSGKTTLSIHAIASAQKAGGIAAFIDAEHAFDRLYAQKLGVDIENLLISQPDNGEQALEIAENLIRSGDLDIIVIDQAGHGSGREPQSDAVRRPRIGSGDVGVAVDVFTLVEDIVDEQFVAPLAAVQAEAQVQEAKGLLLA